MLKVISGNISHFVLYSSRATDWDQRDHLLRSIIGKLPTDVQRQFIIDEYTVRFGDMVEGTYHCISHSASGEGTDSIVVVYSSLVVVYSSLVCLQ